MNKTEELEDLGRFTVVREQVVSHMIEQGAKARFVSTHVARECGIASASCNNVFQALQASGWITRTPTPGTAKEFKWAAGGIGMARGYIKRYRKARGL